MSSDRRSPEQVEVDIRDEIRHHLEERVSELVARGIPHDEAARAALAAFGDVADVHAALRQIAGSDGGEEARRQQGHQEQPAEACAAVHRDGAARAPHRFGLALVRIAAAKRRDA